MNVSLRQLRYVMTAARLRSISKAAHHLRISQSSIAAAINKFEAEFSVTIFVRQQAKGLVLTTVGSEILGRTGRFLSEVDSFVQDLSGLGESLEGAINVACFAPVSPHFLPPIIRDLTRQHPNVSVHIHEGDLRSVQEFLRDGIADVVLTYDLGLDSAFEAESLRGAPPHVILATNDPLAAKSEVKLADLVDRPMILLDLPESRTYFELMFEALGAQPKIVHRTQTYELVRGLVATGLGFSILNVRPIIDATYTGRKIAYRRLAGKVRTPNFVLARRAHDFPTPLMEAFSSACRDFFHSDRAMRHIVS
jgi:DNA-binding transcriptional LysR family regulator